MLNNNGSEVFEIAVTIGAMNSHSSVFTDGKEWRKEGQMVIADMIEPEKEQENKKKLSKVKKRIR